MIRKIIVLLLIATAWECVQSPSALAQNSDPCVAITTWWFPDPIPFGWYFYGAYPGTFAYLIAAKTCPAPPECPCKQNTPDPEGSKPIVFASGDTYVEDTDISLPGLGGGYQAFARTRFKQHRQLALALDVIGQICRQQGPGGISPVA